MLFAVRMDVRLPPDMDPAVREDTLAREREYSRRLQRSGVWVHLWRCVGEYANLSIFEVEGNEHLHDVLWRLPLFPYLRIEVIPLATHPSSIRSATAAPPPSQVP